MQTQSDVSTVIDLTRHARLAFDQLFHRGYMGPVVDSQPRAPRPHSIVTFNIPRKCVPSDAETLHDIFSGIAHHNPTLNAYTKLLGMLSLAVTQPTNGFGAQASPGVDKRGEVAGNGDALTFDHEGTRYNRTEQCIEDLVTQSNVVIGYRVWIFVLDPNLNLGAALRDVAVSNHTIYHTNRNGGGTAGVSEGNVYIHHANVDNEAAVYDLFSTFVSEGVSSCAFHQNAERTHFRRLDTTLSSMAQGASRAGRTLTDRESDVHPTAVLSPLAAFTFHIDRVCEEQSTLNNYFRVPASVPEESADGDDDIVAHDPSGQEMDLADQELLALRNQMRAGGGGSGDDEEGVGSGAANERSGADFLQFPRGDLVQRIPIYLFGRKLPNVPLRIAYTGRHGDDEIDVAGIDLDVINEKLDVSTPLNEDMTSRDRKRILKRLYDQYVTANFDESSEQYFAFDEDEINFYSLDICVDTLRRIYACFLVQDDIVNIQREMREIRRKLTVSQRVILHDEALVDYGDDSGDRVVLPVPLPELCTEEGVTRAELEHFAKKDDILKLRLENHAVTNRIISDFQRGSPEFYEAMADFRTEAATKFWSVFMESNNIAEPLKKARTFFKGLQIRNHWPEHYILAEDLSAFSNLIMLLLSRYNQIFRGASTQTIFLLLYTVSINTAMYHFGLRPNVLLTGDGGAGKSFPMLAVQNLVAPGTFKAYTHVTSKAFSTGRSFSDETFCMHEAARSLIGVDERGFDNTGDPIFKDRLTRQRCGTLAFGQDESGQRVTLEDEVMLMGNVVLATNDAVPAEDKALMQRFINKPVNYTKREGFDKGDQSHVNSTEYNGRVDALHKQAAQVFSFYCLVVEKMVEAWIIPEPSIDCANTFMREILRIYHEDTGIEVSNARKRTMVTHLMRTGAVMNAVHVGLCSSVAWKISHDTGPDGVRRIRPFHPTMIIENVMPRLYVSDEIAVFYMTMCSFMWEPLNQFEILDTVVSQMNGKPQDPERVLNCRTTSFRRVKNPRHKRYSGASKSAGAGSSGFGVANSGAAAAEEPEFILDTNYVSITTTAASLAYSKVSQAATASRPSVTEVRRVFSSLKTTWRPLHRSSICATGATGDDDEDSEDAAFLNDDDDDEEDLDSSTDGIGSFRMMGATVGAGRASTGALSQEEIYKTRQFRWRCHTNDLAEASAPIVIIEPDPTSRAKRVVISVMIEALTDDTFQNGIMRAVRSFMEKSNVPAAGRKILSASDYQHEHGNGRIEVMPQYKEVLHLQRKSEPMILRHMQIGTQDSNAFITSTLHHNPSDTNAAQIMQQLSLGTRLDEPANAHYARLHWRACDMPPSDDWYQYMPETDTERIIALQNALNPDERSTIHPVVDYPRGPAVVEIERREIERFITENPNSELAKNFYVGAGDFHEKSSLADIIHGLPYCHYKFETGEIEFSPTATLEEREYVKGIADKTRNFSKTYSSIRSERSDAGSARVPHRVTDRRVVNNARANASFRNSFNSRLQDLHTEISSLSRQFEQAGPAAVPQRFSSDRKRARKSSKSSAAFSPSKSRKATANSNPSTSSVRIH